jgi:hypothetical protein
MPDRRKHQRRPNGAAAADTGRGVPEQIAAERIRFPLDRVARPTAAPPKRHEPPPRR